MAPKGRSTNEIELSARDVLENIGIGIYNQEKIKKNPYEQQLKGTLSNARFHDGLHKAADLGVIPGPSHFSQLYYKKHTNNTKYYKDDRHPCHGRQGKRFDEGQKFECGNDKIIGNSDKYGSCAPPRRRHICDQNLEFLDNNHTDTIHDVLGNVLVTAKYEGESIVNDHPDKKNNGNKSGICTSLARSFADIGDIVRGRDMFKPNDKDAVRHGLKVVFKKIYDKLSPKVQEHYKDVDGSGNYYKLREDWWTANRDQVWKAITYKAPQDANYFRNVSGTTMAFTSAGKCRHNDNSVPTNLDYVPQFLRWYDEWADDFCRIRNHKLQKVKDTCQGYNNSGYRIYCSGDGEDCTNILKQNFNIVSDFFCPSCKTECTNYKKWINKKQGEFNKQKKKYEKEINNIASNSDNTYDKKVYKTLKSMYPLDTKFVATLKEAPFCNNNNVDGIIDFNKPDDTFSSSTYCDSCPAFGVICENGTCTKVNEHHHHHH
nr:erythrocyte membrane protein 1 alpha domain [synthetic construct]